MVQGHGPITSQELQTDKPYDPGFVHLPSEAPKSSSPPSLLDEFKGFTLPLNAHFDTPPVVNFLTQAPAQPVPPNSLTTSSISSPNDSGLSSPFPTTPITPDSVQQNAVVDQPPPSNAPSASMPGDSADMSKSLVDKLQDAATYISNVDKQMEIEGEKTYQNNIITESTRKGIDMKTAGRIQKNRVRATASRARQKKEIEILKNLVKELSSRIVQLKPIAHAVHNALKEKRPSAEKFRPTELENNSSSMTDGAETSSPDKTTPDTLTTHFDSVNAHCESTMPPIGNTFIVSSRSQSFDKHSTGDLLSVTTSLPAVETNLDEFINSAWIYGQSSYDGMVTSVEKSNTGCSIFDFTVTDQKEGFWGE